MSFLSLALSNVSCKLNTLLEPKLTHSIEYDLEQTAIIYLLLSGKQYTRQQY